MKDALTRPEVQKVLSDPKIQHLIELLKDRVEEAQRYDNNILHCHYCLGVGTWKLRLMESSSQRFDCSSTMES